MTRDDNEPPSYSFRNRFRLVQNQRLDAGDALEIPLAMSAIETVVIRGAKAPEGEETRFDGPIIVSKTDELVLLGEEYAMPDLRARRAASGGTSWLPYWHAKVSASTSACSKNQSGCSISALLPTARL
ncbi:hypothetical protein [Mycobacterium sp. SMC-11]|uniref:hypothetical protein n=1 Tax=Mycobacterium sp. SMC-11 TaxID=3385969 RepID=UPI00390CAC0B